MKSAKLLHLVEFHVSSLLQRIYRSQLSLLNCGYSSEYQELHEHDLALPQICQPLHSDNEGINHGIPEQQSFHIGYAVQAGQTGIFSHEYRLL